MNRHPQARPILALFVLALLPIACDYGSQIPKTSRGLTGQLPIKRGQPGENPSAFVGSIPASTTDSGESKEKREAILNNVVQLIQSAATTPGGQHFGIAVKNLNEYFEQGTRPSDYYLGVDSRKFLQAMFGSAEAIRQFESPSFEMIDARHIEDCMLYNEIATRVAGERLPGEVDDLPRVRRLFEWVVAQIQLVPPGSLSPPNMAHAPVRPYDALLRGMAVEEGAWSERGWLFMSLCRQLGIDVGLISYTPRRAPASLSVVPVDSDAATQPVTWVCIALIGDKAYLFDQRLGIPVPDARGDGVATLEDALTNPEILDRLDLPGQFPYGTTRAALLASTDKVTILLDSSQGYFSPKMRLLQSRLTGRNRTILFRDPYEQGMHFARALGQRLGDVRIWSLPYNTQMALFTTGKSIDPTLYTLRSFDGSLPLLYARMAQLKGDLPAAISQYVTMRLTTGALRRDKKTPITPAEQHEIDVYATYFIALCHLEQKNAGQAAFFFNQFLQKTPEPAPNQREFCHMFRWGAETNLGLIALRKGDIPSATRHLSAPNPTVQWQGNLWLARGLVWRDPSSPPGSPLPPAPLPAPAPVLAPALPNPLGGLDLLAPPIAPR